MSRIVLSAIALALGLLNTPIWADSASRDRRVALVVGNSAYQHAPALPNPARDAKALAAKFKNAGFEVVEAQYEVGHLDFKRAIRKFEDTAADSDIAVVYFAGHGIEIHGVNYIIPVDAKLASDRDAEDEAITLDRLMESVDGARRVRLVILDACRDNPFARNMKHQRTASVRGINPGLVAVEPSSSNTLIAFAAKAGSVAEDGEREHSPFAAALLDHLFVPGLDLRFAFGRVRDDVLKNTGNRQEPFVYGSLGKDNVALVPGPKQEYTLTPSEFEGEKSDYNLVEKIGTRGAWEVFLAQHPKGFYSELARQQIDKLKSADAAQITVAAYEPSKTPTPAPSTDEQRAWDKIKDSNDASDFRAFIKRYPSSPLANKAQTHLDAIARAEEEKAWNKIKDSGDPAKFRDFIKKYPASPLAATAQSNLDALARAAQEREEKARAEREAKAAEEARQRAEHEAALERAEKERQEKIAEARRQAAEAARQKAEEEAALKRAQQEAKEAEEARRKAEREAALKAEEEERQKKAEEAARARHEAEAARQRAEEERQRKAEEAVRIKQEAEAARQKAEQEEALKRAQEQVKVAEEARLKAERAAELKREEERQKQAAEAARVKKAAEAEAAPQRADQEAALKRAQEEANAAEEARLKAERETMLKREQEAKAVEQARLQAEHEAALKREQEERQKRAAEAALAREQAEAVAAQKKAEQEAAFKLEEQERRKKAEEAARAKQEAEAEAARKEAERQAALKRAEEEAKAAEQARQRAEREAALEREEEQRQKKAADAARAKEEAACKREEDRLSSLKAGKKALSDLRQLEQGLTCEKLRPLVTAALDRVNAMPDVNTPAQIRSAQQELTRLGCFAGELDGSLSDPTKTAVRRYQSERGKPTGNVEITDAFLTELKEQSTRVCPLVCPRGKVVAGEHCVAAEKPATVVHRPKEEDEGLQARRHVKHEEEPAAARRHVKHEEEPAAARRRARIEEERPAPHHREARPVAAPRIRQEAVGYSGGGHTGGATIGVGF
jgi:hypothetical protein